MTVGTVEITIAFSVLFQCVSGEKSRRKVLIYKYFNSLTVIGRVAFDNKCRILALNCGSLSIVFANACVMIMVHGFIYICIHKRKLGNLFRQTSPPFNPGR